MITPLPGAIDTKPGSATRPFPGIDANVLDDSGRPVRAPTGGFLVLEKPWPGMLRNIWGDPKRFQEQYWSRYEGIYLAGDGAHRDANDYFWIMGRIDDVMNVSGHRIGTMEVESALVSHPNVAEAAVVGRPDDLTGTAIVAFVTPRAGTAADDKLRAGLLDQVAAQIGSIAKPKEIRFTDALPKTRSGKIMRRLLRNIANGEEHVGDTTTLEDYNVLARLREAEEG
jgi:acetyl-CoA synthetase